MKNWYSSKTIWANILVILGGVLITISGELEAGTTLTVTGLINIVLRTVTSTRLK